MQNITISFQVELALWDTAGQEAYDRLRPLSYANSDVIIICFSIGSPTSLANAEQKWRAEVNNYRPGIPILLVGNKSDLRTDKETIRKLQKAKPTPLKPVQYSEGDLVAKKIKAFAYLECSAKERTGIEEVFMTATRGKREKKARPICILL